jgi:hypothetical protein
MREPRGRAGALLLGAALGAAIWLLSPTLAGHREPWDAGGGYYVAALLGAGLLGGLLVPRRWRAIAGGVYAGQALVLLGGVIVRPGDGGLWPLGLLMLGFYSVLALLGAGVGAAARRMGGRA